MKYCLIFLLVFQSAFAQSFTTRVSPKIIGKQDVLLVEYIADNVSIDQFNLPRFVNWTLVSGPDVSSSKMIVNSSVKQQTIYSVTLLPQITGVIIIPGATALINNRPYRSNQVSVQVKNVPHMGGQPSASQQPQVSILDMPDMPARLPYNQYLKRGENPIDKIKNNLFVRLEVSKTDCFVGEPIIATYKLCSRLRSQSKVVKQPTFTGCTVDELTSANPQQHVEKINGQEYNVFVVRRVRLTPLDAGQLTLPSTSIENNVSFYTTEQRDVFGNPAGPAENHIVTLENKPALVNVKALPAAPVGTDFSGAVGNFEVGFKAVERQFTNAGTNHLMLIIEGSGNLQPVKLPAIKLPKGIETFDASEKEDIDKESVPIRNRKVFTIPFSADKIGNYVLPTVSFTYFDPAADKYVTKKTPSFLFKVLPGSKAMSANDGSGNSFADFDNRLYVLLGVGLLAIILGIAWYSGTRRSKLPPEIKKQEKIIETSIPVQENLLQTNEALYKIRQLEPNENTSLFYKQLYKNLGDYLIGKFNIQPTEIKKYADEHLRIAVPLHEFQNLVDTCTLGMYTPAFSMDEALQHRLKAIEIIEKLESA